MINSKSTTRRPAPTWTLFQRYCEGYIMGQWHEWITLTQTKRNGYRLRAGTSCPHELRVSIPKIKDGATLAAAVEKCLRDSSFDGDSLSDVEVPDCDELLTSMKGKVDDEMLAAARRYLDEDEDEDDEEEED